MDTLTSTVTIINGPVDPTMATMDSLSSGKSEKEAVDLDPVDSVAVRRAILKMDLTLLPILTMFYLLSFLVCQPVFAFKFRFILSRTLGPRQYW